MTTHRITIPRGAVQVTVPFLKPITVEPLQPDTVIWKNGEPYPPFRDSLDTVTWGPGVYERDGDTYVIQMAI